LPEEDEPPDEAELPDCVPLLDFVPEDFPLDPLDVAPEPEPLEDPVPDELLLPVLEEPVLPEPVLPELVLLAVCVDPGSVAAMAPVAITLATPTPAVTTDSRFIPRRLRADGGSDRPPGSLDIGGSLRRIPVLAALCLIQRFGSSKNSLRCCGHHLHRHSDRPGGPALAGRFEELSPVLTMRQQAEGNLLRSSELLLKAVATAGGHPARRR
jgi:hypothetical protein